MTLTMMDKKAVRAENTAWPQWLEQEFEEERRRPNGCVGTELLSESDRVRVWTIRLKPGERVGFHRHVLDYFWSAITSGRGRQHLQDGSTVEHGYLAGETRHETYPKGESRFTPTDDEKMKMRPDVMASLRKPANAPPVSAA